MPPPLLLHVYPTFAIGGAQARFVACANYYGRAFRHAVIAIDGRLDCRARLSADLDVTFPDVRPIGGGMARRVLHLRRTIRGISPDVLVTSNWGAMDWVIAGLGMPGLRHIHTEDGFGPEEWSQQLSRRVWTRRVMLRRSTVVVPSLTLQAIATGTWRLSPGRTHYIPNGVDVARFSPAPPSERPMLTIGAVAALRPEKNLARLVRGFAALRRERTARLVIVGDGPNRASLGALAVELGIADDVSFAGELHDVEHAYRSFDVFALSSDTEQMPLSVLEAMASGLPVVSTMVGDVVHMVSGANAPFVTPLDDDGLGLAASLKTLIDNPALRARIGLDNRARAVTGFPQEAMLRSYADLYGMVRGRSKPTQYTATNSTAAQLK
jgi:glycosyltransferase involved in cell wall biosynthesis